MNFDGYYRKAENYIKYLRSVSTEDRKMRYQNRNMQFNGEKCLSKLGKVGRNRKLPFEPKKRLLNCYVTPPI